MTFADSPPEGEFGSPRSRRLSGRRRFAAIRTWRARAQSGVITVHAAPNHLEWSRFGLATPGVRGAVVRNRLRRRLRVALRQPVMSTTGLDLVVRAGAGAVDAGLVQLGRDCAAAVGRAAELVAERSKAAECG